MQILFTGASSFTGMHFVKELSTHHTVFCTFTKAHDAYSGIEKERIESIIPHIIPLWNTRFGSPQFLSILKQHSFDTYAHHMAWTKGYGTNKYPIEKAIQNNTLNLPYVTSLLQRNGCSQIILSNTVLEGDDVDLQEGHAPFEPHGEAKKRTTALFCSQSPLPIRRFIIPNPIGTFDNIRLVESLHQQWTQRQTPHIQYPENIRDNIPIPVLTKRYSSFLNENIPVASPSGWKESNSDFVERIARELSKRFAYNTPVVLGPQKDHSQPRILCNTESALENWDASRFWDTLSLHYKKRFYAL